MTSELDLLNAITDADAKAPKTTVTPAEVLAQTLYYKVRGGRVSYAAAVAKMPKTAAAAKWNARLVAEFGPVR